jgi:hypothetical protein
MYLFIDSLLCPNTVLSEWCTKETRLAKWSIQDFQWHSLQFIKLTGNLFIKSDEQLIHM